jgi:hypothetical protein
MSSKDGESSGQTRETWSKYVEKKKKDTRLPGSNNRLEIFCREINGQNKPQHLPSVPFGFRLRPSGS